MEAQLGNNKNKVAREMYENFSELYAVIKATEILEKAYKREIIQPAEYETECQKLIARFKELSCSLRDTVPNIVKFHETYNMDCPAALNRLIISGVPATMEHRAAAAASGRTPLVTLVEYVQSYMTTMNVLKRKTTAVDQVYPYLSDVSRSLNKLLFLPPDFEGKTKMNKWRESLSKLQADYVLTEQEERQLSFDLESTYESFKAALPTTGI